MDIFEKIFNFNKKIEPKTYPFTQWCTFGNHQYRTHKEDPTVEFVDKKTGKRKLIVDFYGRIHNFPGIVEEECWVKYLTSKRNLMPIIRFRTDFEKYDDEKYIMIWEIQPDGRYWGDDDGFGMENDEEICLYAFIDKNGDFMGPFKIYSVGNKIFLDKEN